MINFVFSLRREIVSFLPRVRTEGQSISLLMTKCDFYLVAAGALGGIGGLIGTEDGVFAIFNGSVTALGDANADCDSLTGNRAGLDGSSDVLAHEWT